VCTADWELAFDKLLDFVLSRRARATESRTSGEISLISRTEDSPSASFDELAYALRQGVGSSGGWDQKLDAELATCAWNPWRVLEWQGSHEERRLAAWVTQQRWLKRQGLLSAEAVARLEVRSTEFWDSIRIFTGMYT
jgi:hypothetical protein